MAKDDHAVVVGVSRYPDFQSLQGPDLDANDFVAWLLNEGQVDTNNIYKVTSNDPPPASPGEPTEIQVATIFKSLGERAKRGRIGRRLYIYLSGHGICFDADFGEEKVAVLMANATRQQSLPHIPGRTYALWFQAAKAFDEVVLFMDCCRSDRTNSPEYPFPCKPVYPKSKDKVKSYYVFATQKNEAAVERAIGPEGQVRGLFTMALLDGLRGGSTRRNGRVTAKSLRGSVFHYLDEHDKGKDRQEPDFVGPDNFVFL